MDDSMDVSAFEVDASSDFEPEPKPVKAKAAAKKSSAAASKPKPATKQTTAKTSKGGAPKTKAGAKPKKRSKQESDDENTGDVADSVNDDSLLSNTPPSAKRQKKVPAKKAAAPLAEVANESFAMDEGSAAPKTKAASSKNTGASDQYQKLSQHEHILKRPDTYIGSVERTTEQLWVYNSELDQMENRKVSFVPGLYKIFDEILVNAADNKQNDKNMNEMRIWVDKEKGVIAVKNNGRGIPIEVHTKYGVYIPEMIFGHLLSSSNYDDAQAKVTGGRNGYGAKLTNIYSTQFSLETVDSRSKQKYRQTWHDNMTVMDKAKITPCKDDDYTLVTFKPDFAKFGMDQMDDDFEALVKRRVYDMAGTAKGVKVYLNQERIKITKFKQYMEMYTKAIKTENIADNGSAPEQVILTDQPHERWEIGFAVSDGSFQQVSFVNSLATTSGGTHVNYIADQIVDKLAAIVAKKNKGGVKLKPSQIRNHMFLFVNALIVNPTFTSQTKEQLTTKASAFGSKPVVSEKFLKDIANTEVVNNILHFAQQKADKVLAKSDGSRRQRMNNSKLTDANWAGTKNGWRCTLILTEGDSATPLALAGRAVVNPDLFGVFPLRGKLLNVRDASIDQISKNQEIQNIKKFMGLQHKKEYSDTKSLRYGHLMIMTDQDHDGSHIKGLLINFLQVQFPSLLKLDGFLMEFITPIVKVWKGDPKRPKAKLDFFTMPEYEAWKAQPGNQKGWEHKYFKGLGTSDTADAEIYFADPDRHLKQFHTIQQGEPEMIDLAFSKQKTDARKGWLQNFQPGTYLDMSTNEQITYDDFINKELILFSMADNMRSIPSVVDGFKPTQRKVLYTCFRRNLKKDIKVVELAGSVSGLTAYSYGDASLQQTIVGLAQNFVGSNNINCLEPSGNFGSRLQGGSDAASARYIYTRLSPFARKIFHQTDEALLSYNVDDGKTIEPETYVPIVPMILINGADGIGTGWSTSIPNYKPEEVIENLKRRMEGDSKDAMIPMKPWFRGWTGEVEDVGSNRFKFSGKIEEVGDNEVRVTELPVRVWTQDFKDRLEDIIKAEKVPSFIKDYTEYNTPRKVDFIIKMDEKKMNECREKGFEDAFKLSKTMATTNLVAFDGQGRIHKYATPLDMMEEFYHIRLRMYQKRKAFLLGEMQKELERMTNQRRFVQMIIDGRLVVSKKKKAALVVELQNLNFTRFPKVIDAKKEGEFEPVVEEEDDSDDAQVAAGASDYDYLLGMAIWSLTYERVEKLSRQIGDKEEEIDVLSKKSPKDIWREDLDELLIEWHTQLDEEAKREKKAKSRGRRASAKLGVGGKAGKKRKAGDDSDFSDFEVKKPKASKVKSKAITGLLATSASGPVSAVEQKPTYKPPAVQTTLDGIFEEGSVKIEMPLEGGVTGPAIKAKPAAAPAKARAKKKADSDEDMEDAPVGKGKPKKAIASKDSDDEDLFAAIAKEAPSKSPPAAAPRARAGRAAAQKAKSYNFGGSDSEEDDSMEDMLGDISAKVKGIGASQNNGPTRLFHPPSVSRPSTSRPTSAHGNRIMSKKLTADLEVSNDETDWAALAQNSPQKAMHHTILSDDDSMDVIEAPPKPKPASKQPAAKSKPSSAATALKPKKAAAPPVPAPALVPKTLSPAAKAYAAKIAKAEAAKTTTTTKSKPVAKSKLASSKLRKKLDSDDEEDDIDDDDDDDALANDILSDDNEPITKPAARPARRAAAAATARSKYVADEDLDSEADEDGQDDGVDPYDDDF